MKKLMLAFSVTLLASNAFAISDADLKAACVGKGSEKLAEQARAYKCNVNLDEVVAVDVDNRWYNPSKYVWYAANSDCDIDGVLQVMVQYSGGECF